MSQLKMFRNSMNKNIIKSFYHKKNTSSAIIKILKKNYDFFFQQKK